METTFTSEDRRLNVVLHSNTLPAAQAEYYGRVQRNSDTITLKNLISHIGEHETSVRPLTIQYCAGLLKTEIFRQLAAGNAINVLDICTVYLGVKGGVSGQNPGVEDVQSFTVRCMPTAELRAVTKNLGVASVVKAERSGLINSVVDLFSGEADSVITPNRSLRVSGSRLRIAGENPANGIYFVSVADPETRIKVSDAYITRNLPKTLEFYVPDALVSGQAYFIELVSQFTSGAALLKEPRTTRSPVELTVA